MSEEKKSKNTMMVENKTKSIKVFPCAEKGSVVLKMGVNPIEGDLYKELIKNKDFGKKIEQGQILAWPDPVKDAPNEKAKQEAGKIEGDNKAQGAAEDLAKYTNKEAQKIVSETLDIEVLKRWREEEGRGAISSAIERQIKKVSPDEE